MRSCGSLEVDRLQRHARSTAASWSPRRRWRPDLTDKPTLAEEVARIVGYDRIPSVLPVAPPGRGLTRAQQLRRARRRTRSPPPAPPRSSRTRSCPSRRTDLHGSRRRTPWRVRLANPLDGRARRCCAAPCSPGWSASRAATCPAGSPTSPCSRLGTVFLPEPRRDLRQPADFPCGERPAERRDPRRPRREHPAAALARRARCSSATACASSPGRARSPRRARRRARRSPAARAALAGADAGSSRATTPRMHPGRTAEMLRRRHRRRLRRRDAAARWPSELDLPRVVAVLELDLDALIERRPPRGRHDTDRRASRPPPRTSRWSSAAERPGRRRARRGRRGRRRAARARSSSSTTTAARACRRARSRSPSRCASARPTARSPRRRRATRSSPASRSRPSASGATLRE